jgi:hypothetical protein
MYLLMGVDDLIPELSWWEVGSLRDVEEFLYVGTVELPPRDRP